MAIIKLNLSGHTNENLDQMGFTFPETLHVDLSDPDLGQKLTDFLAPLITSGDQVVVALPGLAPLAALVLVIIHGLTGTFPVIQPLVRGQSGFTPAPQIDLQTLRNDVARTARKDVIVL
jgi:hypothetical protein